MKSTIKSILACTILLLLVGGCERSEKDKVVIITVAAQTVLHPLAPGNIKTEHMVITDEANQIDYLPLGSIEKFEYEKGYEYKLLVKKTILKDPPADASNLVYTLIEVLSKEKR